MAGIDTILKEIFGFYEFKPGQRQIMETVATGESGAAIFFTGDGKSLCYQLPALMEQGMTLEVSPPPFFLS